VPFARTEHNLLEIFETVCDNKMYTKPLSDLESDDAPDLPEQSDESEEAAPPMTTAEIAAAEAPAAAAEAAAPPTASADENTATSDSVPSDASSSTSTSTSASSAPALAPNPAPEGEEKPKKKPVKKRNKRLRAMCHQMLEDHHDDFLYTFHKNQKQSKVRLCVEKVKGMVLDPCGARTQPFCAYWTVFQCNDRRSVCVGLGCFCIEFQRSCGGLVYVVFAVCAPPPVDRDEL